MLEVTGNLPYIQRKYLVEKLGEEGFKKLLDKADKKTKELYSGMLLSTKWYPQENYDEVLELMEEEFGTEEIDRYSSWIAEKQLVGLYGLVAKFLSLKRITPYAQKFWDKTYSQGSITVLNNDPDYIRLKVENIVLSELYVYSLMQYLKRWVEISQKTNMVKAFMKRLSADSFTLEFNF